MNPATRSDKLKQLEEAEAWMAEDEDMPISVFAKANLVTILDAMAIEEPKA